MAHLFWVNQEFDDSKKFDDLLEQYRNKTKYEFGQNDSRTMKAHCEKFNKNINEYQNLQYYYRSNKTNCPFALQVTANLKKKVLIVRKWEPNHNHPPPAVETTDDDDDDDNDNDDMHRVDDDPGDKRNSDNGSSDELEAAQRKEKRGSLARKRQRDVNTTKNIDNNSIDQLPVSKMLKKIKQSIEYDENEKTVTKKKHMLSKLLGKFEKLDNPTHSSNEVDEDPVYLGVPF
ncbi:uncharacterized protein LOC141538313 [Cotesia typhae]|uniref:uncharacterized protein LOC141538313 n=1 Tax=Cotesia typhae TaxID=2053667 RepID=UPI003D68D639